MSGVMDLPNPNWKKFTCPARGWIAEELSDEVWCQGGHSPEKPRHAPRQMRLEERDRVRLAVRRLRAARRNGDAVQPAMRRGYSAYGYGLHRDAEILVDGPGDASSVTAPKIAPLALGK